MLTSSITKSLLQPYPGFPKNPITFSTAPAAKVSNLKTGSQAPLPLIEQFPALVKVKVLRKMQSEFCRRNPMCMSKFESFCY
jgi:hypothetical protein